MRRALPLALVLAACTPFELDPLRIDVASNCDRVEVTPRILGVDGPGRPWARVLAIAIDEPGAASGWLLVIRRPPGGLDELAILYLDAAGTVTVDQVLDHPVSAAAGFELVPSATPGLAYLSHGEIGSFTLWRLEAGISEPVRRSQNLASLPLFCDLDHDNVQESCDAWMWQHRLLFVQQRPMLFTMPPAALDSQVDLWVSRFEWPEVGSMQFLPDIVLHFRPACDRGSVADIEACNALYDGYSYPRIEVIGAQTDARNPRSAVALYRELDDGSGFVLPDIALVELFAGELGVNGSPSSHPLNPTPRDTGPRGLAQDEFSTYVHYTSTESDAVLAQRSLGDDQGDAFTVLGRDGLDIQPEHELIQLDDDIALSRIVDGNWEILKVFPDAPAESMVTSYSVPGEVLAVEAAGPGSFLVRRQSDRADLVYVACAAEDAEL